MTYLVDLDRLFINASPNFCPLCGHDFDYDNNVCKCPRCGLVMTSDDDTLVRVRINGKWYDIRV